MPAVGLALLWLGYSVAYYGVTQIRGNNYGFLDLMLPGRWSVVRQAPPPNDRGESPVAGSSTSSTTTVPETSSPTTPEGAVTATPGGATSSVPGPLGNPSPGLPMD